MPCLQNSQDPSGDNQGAGQGDRFGSSPGGNHFLPFPTTTTTFSSASPSPFHLTATYPPSLPPRSVPDIASPVIPKHATLPALLPCLPFHTHTHTHTCRTSLWWPWVRQGGWVVGGWVGGDLLPPLPLWGGGGGGALPSCILYAILYAIWDRAYGPLPPSCHLVPCGLMPVSSSGRGFSQSDPPMTIAAFLPLQQHPR